jgi:Fe-S-cluster containining protein
MDRYRTLLQRLDAWFARGRERHPRVIPCASGCSACCHGPFDISVADMALLRHGVAKLPPDVRADVLAKARELLDRARALEPTWKAPYDVETIGDRFDAVCEGLADAPCPLLDEAGRCRIYDDRPLVCRLIGLPMRSLGGRTIENCCPIMSGFPDYAALPPVEFDLEGFEAEEMECIRAAARDIFGDEAFSGYQTFIAAALLMLADPRSASESTSTPR